MSVLSPAHTAYRLFVCTDCHPDYQDEDTPDDERHEKPYELVVPLDGSVLLEDASRDICCPVENCPRCGSMLSLVSSGNVIVADEPFALKRVAMVLAVTNCHDADRWKGYTATAREILAAIRQGAR